jgi:hypothetical protein
LTCRDEGLTTFVVGGQLQRVDHPQHLVVARFRLGVRLSFTAGDFFADPLPTGDVLVDEASTVGRGFRMGRGGFEPPTDGL